jgi:hypothetical protein
MAHALSYTAPLPWLDSIELFRVYAQSTPRLPDTYGQTGISAQMSLRYDWRLPTINDTTQMAQFGYHFKRSSNDLEFGGFQVFKPGAARCHRRRRALQMVGIRRFPLDLWRAFSRSDAERLKGADGAFVHVGRDMNCR